MNDASNDIRDHLDLIAAGRHPAVARIESNAAESRVFFRNGKILRTLTGRNDPCPCASGKKFKKCCMATVKPTSPFRLSLVQNPTKGALTPDASAKAPEKAS